MAEVRSKHTKSLLAETNAELVDGRKKRNKRRMWLGLALFLVLLGGFVYFAWYPDFLIKTVNISGNRVLSQNKLENAIYEYLNGRYIYVLPNKNAFIFDSGELEKFLRQKYPIINNIETNQKIPDFLAVSISERQPHALWCNLSPNDCVFIDMAGYAYDTAPYFSRPLFNVYEVPGAEINKQVLDENSFNYAETVVQDLAKQQIIVQKIRPKGEGVFEFDIILPNQVLPTEFISNLNLGSVETLNRLYTLINSDDVVNKNKGKGLKHIDIRFGNQIVYKFY